MQGGFNICQLVKRLQPKLVIPLDNGSFPQTGPLAKLLWTQETDDTLPTRLEAADVQGVQVRLCSPPGQAMDIRL